MLDIMEFGILFNKRRRQEQLNQAEIAQKILNPSVTIDADPEPRIVSLPNVHHLATQVHGHLSTPAASVLELVSALHPTPAVAGKPQAEAINLITQIAKGGRGKYAGPVGWVDANGNGAFAVGLR